MKMNTQISISKMVIMMIALCFLINPTSAANFIVGGVSGWALESNMKSWRSSHSFIIGDILGIS